MQPTTNPHAANERRLAEIIAREAVEIIHGKPMIEIDITRHRHTYLHTIARNGVAGKPAIIDRERAEQIIRYHSNGKLPDEVNLDVCHPRRWSWQVLVDLA